MVNKRRIGGGGRRIIVKVTCDFFQTLQNERTDPDAEVGRYDVHQSEPGDHFEPVDIQLQPHNHRPLPNLINNFKNRTLHSGYTDLYNFPCYGLKKKKTTPTKEIQANMLLAYSLLTAFAFFWIDIKTKNITFSRGKKWLRTQSGLTYFFIYINTSN